MYCGEEVCYRAKFEYCENEDAYFAAQELKEENRRKKREAYLCKRKSTL